MKFKVIINSILDSIDYGFNYIGVGLLRLPTFRILNVIITPKIQTTFVFIVGFFVGTMWISNAFAHGGHGDEEAEKLGGSVVVLSGNTFINPKEIKSDSLMNQSYPGIIISDEYGSIFSSREGIVTKLSANLGDTVKKGQVVATISTFSNAPEIIALLAGKKADIAISQGQLNAAHNVVGYLQSQNNSPSSIIQNVFDQKKKAIDISIDTQKQQLEVKIDNLKAQMNAKKQLVEANKLSSQSIIGLNEQKQASIQKSLQGSIQNAISNLSHVFAKSDITYQGFDREFNKNIYRGTIDNNQRYTFLNLMLQVISQYNKRDTLSIIDKFNLAQLTEKTINEGITLLGVSSIFVDYTQTQKNEDIALLISTYSDKDIGITTILSTYKELQKELLGSNAIASGGIIQANVELAGIEQEIVLLTKQIDLLDAEKKKELAELNGDQSIRAFDVQKLIIESEAAIVRAEAELNANQNAFEAIQSIAKSTNIVAPFDGIISRKNVGIGQNIQSITPVFDIVGLNTNTKPFIRFEVPVGEFNKLKINQILQIGLGGDEPLFAGSILRIAQSVNQDTQTLTVEGGFDAEVPYPLGTNVRISSQGLSGSVVVEIPNTAIKQDEDGKDFVYKVLPDNTLKKRIIITAYTEGEKTYINQGLKATDTIVTNIYEGERIDGMTVEINK